MINESIDNRKEKRDAVVAGRMTTFNPGWGPTQTDV
jgi:hypothetical protein